MSIPAITISQLEIGYRNMAGESGFSRSGINFTAREGEIVALIGPNGIGKSTLMRTMAGFQQPWSGKVMYGGQTVDSFTPAELSRMISFVSTETVQVSNMRVAELVAYGRFPYTNWLGRLQEKDHKKVRESLSMVGLLHFAHRAVTRLSDGERQRAMIARAIAQDTPVIMLDEPTAFLDVNNKYEIFHLLTNLAHQSGKSIILTTHDLNIALRETDKLWIMLENESREGAPEDAALQGWLSRMFSSSHVGFDLEGGDFFFRKEHAGFARVMGEGQWMTWTVRALERKGYSLTGDPSANILVEIINAGDESSQPRWRLTLPDGTAEFNSLYDLLCRLA